MPLFDVLCKELAENRTTPWKIANEDELRGFVPVAHDCHGNASRFAKKNDGFVVVEGWIANGARRFAKHSVVADAEGRLMCVTLEPYRTKVPGKFIVHQSRWSATPYAELPIEVTPPPLTEDQVGPWQPN